MKGKITLLMLLSMMSSSTWAALFEFDAISSYEPAFFQFAQIKYLIVGTEKNTGNTLSLDVIIDTSNAATNFIAQKCNNMILMSMDKPGKYYISVTTDTFNRLNNCGIALR